MRYPEPIARSAEHLRQAVARMTRHPAAFHPLTYAVWYDYVSGANAPLNQAVDAHPGPMDDEAIRRLFADHVADTDAATLDRLGGAVRRMADEMAASAQRTVDDSGIKGTRISKKDTEEESYFMGTGGKKGKKGGKKGAAAPAASKFNLNIGVIEELAKVGVDAPSSQADVPATVEKLQEKLSFWKKDQARKTEEVCLEIADTKSFTDMFAERREGQEGDRTPRSRRGRYQRHHRRCT